MMIARVDMQNIFFAKLKNSIPYIVAFFYYIIIHYLIKIDRGDDVEYFQNILQDQSLIDYYKFRYVRWSSRLLIETFLIFFTHNIWLWKILDTLSILIIIYSISYLCNCNYKEKWFLTLLVMCYPFYDMYSAGWIATTLNYLWPLTFVFISVLYIKRLFNRNLKFYEKIILFFSVIFASNQEQTAFILFFVVLYSAIEYYRVKHKYSIIIMTLLLLNILSLIFIMTCPGNSLRVIKEINNWFPGYDDLSFYDKIYLGLLRIEKVIIAIPNAIYLIFCFVIYYAINNYTNSRLFKIISILPLFIVLLHVFFKQYYSSIILEKHFYVPEDLHEIIYRSRSFFPIVTLFLSFICVIFSITKMQFNNKGIINYHYPLILFLIIGVSSQMILAFSPTLYASDYRTFIFLYFTLIFASVFIYSRLKIKSNLPIILASVFVVIHFLEFINRF